MRGEVITFQEPRPRPFKYEAGDTVSKVKGSSKDERKDERMRGRREGKQDESISKTETQDKKNVRQSHEAVVRLDRGEQVTNRG
jgi:hypothetical protein